MSRPTKVLMVIVLVSVAWLTPAMAQRAQPPRLVVINYTGAVVDVFAVTDAAREARGRLDPGASMPIAGVKNGDRFEAAWPGGSSTHTVQLRYDQAYGALQDTWAIQR